MDTIRAEVIRLHAGFKEAIKRRVIDTHTDTQTSLYSSQIEMMCVEEENVKWYTFAAGMLCNSQVDTERSSHIL